MPAFVMQLFRPMAGAESFGETHSGLDDSSGIQVEQMLDTGCKHQQTWRLW